MFFASQAQQTQSLWTFLIVVATFLILVSGLFYKWGKLLWDKNHSFIMVVSLDPYDLRLAETKHLDRRTERKLELVIGDVCNKLIGIRTEIGTFWENVNIRFINRKFSLRLNRIWQYYEVDANTIKVTDFEDVIYKESIRGGDWYFESQENIVGGFDGLYIPPVAVQGGETIWFNLAFEAKNEWNGWLSFEGTLHNHRAFARIKARVYMVQVINKNDKPKKLTKKQFHKLLGKLS